MGRTGGPSGASMHGVTCVLAPRCSQLAGLTSRQRQGLRLASSFPSHATTTELKREGCYENTRDVPFSLNDFHFLKVWHLGRSNSTLFPLDVSLYYDYKNTYKPCRKPGNTDVNAGTSPVSRPRKLRCCEHFLLHSGQTFYKSVVVPFRIFL